MVVSLNGLKLHCVKNEGYMSKKIYNKLVRDKIPSVIEAKGGKPTTRILDDKEYLEALVNKLGEEYEEFKKDRSTEELADILEVIMALRDALGISKEKLEAVRTKKTSDRGAFKDKIFLESVEE